MVVYRFHLKLSEDWTLRVEDGRCVVIAPAIRPSLPPAIRTETMEKKSEAGWLRFNAAENLAELEKGLTQLVERRAPTRLEAHGHTGVVHDHVHVVHAGLITRAAAHQSIKPQFSDETEARVGHGLREVAWLEEIGPDQPVRSLHREKAPCASGEVLTVWVLGVLTLFNVGFFF
jgi:hypothetical protein